MDADSQIAVTSQDLIQTIEMLLADKRWEDAASIARAALAIDPQNAGLRTLLVEAQEAAEPEKQKLEMVEELASQLSRMQVATQAAARLETQKREALEELASKQLARGRLSDAEATANELIRIAPDWAESYNTRGGVLLKRRKLAQAESDFRAALRLAPDQPVYMNNIGLAVHRRGKRKEAIEWFEKAATTDPTFATARKNLSASAGLYLWGDAFVIVFSIAIHAAYAGLRGGSNGRNTVLLLIGVLALIVPVVLVRYWLRRRSLDPIAQTIYQVEARRAWRRPDTRTMVRAGGLLVLLAAFLVALFTNQVQLETLFVILAILWLHRGWTVWRHASGLFQR
jgi:tetratricopeptide (TPR) repeat protein